jgi:hypothetical protein
MEGETLLLVTITSKSKTILSLWKPWKEEDCSLKILGNLITWNEVVGKNIIENPEKTVIGPSMLIVSRPVELYCEHPAG